MESYTAAQAFDTSNISKNLVAGGFVPEQAKTLAITLRDCFEGQQLTRRDLQMLEVELLHRSRTTDKETSLKLKALDAAMASQAALLQRDLKALDVKAETRTRELEATIETRFKEIDAKAETRFKEIDTRAETRFKEIDAKAETRFKELETQAATRNKALEAAMASQAALVQRDISALQIKADNRVRELESVMEIRFKEIDTQVAARFKELETRDREIEAAIETRFKELETRDREIEANLTTQGALIRRDLKLWLGGALVTTIAAVSGATAILSHLLSVTH